MVNVIKTIAKIGLGALGLGVWTALSGCIGYVYITELMHDADNQQIIGEILDMMGFNYAIRH